MRKTCCDECCLHLSFLPAETISGWWRPMLLTSALDSAVSYLRHTLRQNSLTNSRRNISQHYDLVCRGLLLLSLIDSRYFGNLNCVADGPRRLQSNDMFALFLDETMTYSCAIFNVSCILASLSQVDEPIELLKSASSTLLELAGTRGASGRRPDAQA